MDEHEGNGEMHASFRRAMDALGQWLEAHDKYLAAHDRHISKLTKRDLPWWRRRLA